MPPINLLVLYFLSTKFFLMCRKFGNLGFTYYNNIAKRLPNHMENLSALKESKILVDGEQAYNGGSEMKILLQIFTENMIGPVIFEIIQRKGNEGFGEGNFRALFEAIESDQIERGVIK